MLAAVLAAQQDSNPVPGLVLLALLLGGGGWLLWRRRQRKRADAAARAAGLDPGPIPGFRERTKRQLRRLWIPAFVLIFLAPFCAEGLTGATPPQLFFFPVVLAFFMLFYGSGAILIREATLAWRKGWPTILALGAAFAIVEEGLATKVFFEPHRSDLGREMQYGTWAGVHWPLTFFLIVFHAVFAIAIPIFLTMLLFPDRAAVPWVRRRTLPIFGASLAACVLFSALVLHRYNPTPLHYVIAIGAVLMLIAVARVLPTVITRSRRPLVTSPKRLAIFGFCGTFAFWVVGFLFAPWHVPAAIALALEVVIALVCGWNVLRVRGSEYDWFALVGGMLGFFVFTSFLLTALGSFLQILVGIGAWWALLRLRRVLRARDPAAGNHNLPSARHHE